MFAVAGSDEYARLYDIRMYKWDGSGDFGQSADYFCPQHLIGDELVGITGLAFSDQSELLVTYNDENIYLFAKDMGLGSDPSTFASPVFMDSDTDEMKSDHCSAGSPSEKDAELVVAPQVYKGHRNCGTVKGVNFFGPKCEYVVSGSDCGRVFIWKKKGGEIIRVIEADKHVVNCIESHPHTTALASSGIESDIKIWTPKAIDRAMLPTNIEKDRVSDDEYLLDITDDEDDDSDDFEDGEGDEEEEEDMDEVHSCDDAIHDDNECERFFDDDDDAIHDDNECGGGR